MTSIHTTKIVDTECHKVLLPAVMTIAGSDSSGGAGIEADLKTFSAHGVYGLTCITALTAQNTTGVDSIQSTTSDHIRNTLKMNCDDLVLGYTKSPPLKIIKTGMLTSQALKVIPEFLPLFAEYNIRLVVDPVMISTSGSKLMDEEAMKLCLDSLIKSAYLVTPNYHEAVELFKLSSGAKLEQEIKSVDDLVRFVTRLQDLLQCENILVKGGHIPFDKDGNVAKDGNHTTIFDVLYESRTKQVTLFESKFIASEDTHGTGCTLASAISSNLANGAELAKAILASIEYVHRAMQSLTKLGHGNGPLNHHIKVYDIGHGSNVSVNTTFYEYFKLHPQVNDHWITYTSHKFVEKLATNDLPFDQFLYFLKQDYYYLINYSYVHEIAAKLAPTEELKQAQLKIMGEIDTELQNHKKKLSTQYQIDYDSKDLDSQLNPGPACIAYCDYLLNIIKTEDFIGIKVAVAPCLHGYKEAGSFGQNVRRNYDTLKLGKLNSIDESNIYSSWLQDYSSEWYEEAHKTGINTLQTILEMQPLSQSRLHQLTEIFRKVTQLEIAFWDEVLTM
jgi:hydroxymethylpyrimidine/phosphomethylpyrimidine kinase